MTISCNTVEHKIFWLLSRAAETAGAGKAVLSSGPRMNAKKLSGSWKAFDLTAVPIDETDPATGSTESPCSCPLLFTTSTYLQTLFSALPLPRVFSCFDAPYCLILSYVIFSGEFAS